MIEMDEVMFGYELATFASRAELIAKGQQGVWHRSQLSPTMPKAGETPTITVEVNMAQTIEYVQCVISEPEARVIPLTLVDTTWDMLNWRYAQTWEANLPAYPVGTVVQYTVEAHLYDDHAPIAADEGATFSYLVGVGGPPDWAAEARIYQIFIDRFNPGVGQTWLQTDDLNKPFGGTLHGIIEKLDYLADLGINCLWISPIVPDHSYHGYHGLDYFTVNPRMGTLDDVRDLLHEAHARGIRVLLDFVANHVGRDHPAFQKAQSDRESDEYHWFIWQTWPDEYKAYFGLPVLPELNTNYPGARDYLLHSMRFWLEEIGFDGLRLDYASGPSHDFWTATRALIDEAKPDAWIFGEITAPPPVLRSYAGRLHGVLDFPLTQALRDTFAFGSMSLQAFDAFLTNHARYFPPTFSLPSFLDNHDMDRFLWIADGDVRKLKLAALCLFTLPGPPILYNGTEMGISQQNAINEPGSQGMGESRLSMLWDNPPYPELQSYFRDLLYFRKDHPVFWRGERRTVHLDDTAQTYTYVCYDKNDAVLVAFNLSEASQTLELGAFSLTLAPCSGDSQVLNTAQQHQLITR